MAVVHGGMGTCVKIQDTYGGIYALKASQGFWVEDRVAWDRFIEEMKVWLTLSSCDGVVEAYCITRMNELPCICAQWMEGGHLRPLMSRKDPEFFSASVYRLVRTLKWVYNQYRIMHRDLKPENILLDRAQLVYISNWGLARPLAKESKLADLSIARLKSTSRPELTQSGEFLGTIFYASPEQIVGSKTIDYRSDIYSLGCILFEWETGHPPFIGKTPEEIAFQHLYQEPPRLGRRFRSTTFGAEKLIARCLEKDPQ
jgi:serine/threonine protein kinase